MTQNRQRIVFILPTLTMGGAERVLITFMNNIDRGKYEPHLIVFDESGPLHSFIKPGTPIHSLGGVKTRSAVGPLIHELNCLAPDIVVSTMAPVNFTVLLAKFFLKKKTRIIVREAGDPSAIARSQPLPAFIKAAYKRLYARADRVIVPAQCIMDVFQNYLGMKTDRFTLLYNPVDTELIGDKKPDETPSAKNSVHFVAAGRLHEQKGFDRLIEALPHLNHSLPWTLTIYGEGPEEESLEALIKKHKLEKHVTLGGLIQNPWPYYAGADAILLPSRTEAMPNIALEALAVGTPVIAIKDAGGIHEIAARAPPGAVQVLPDMNAFVKAMETVKPNADKRKSLLPGEFKLGYAVQKFESLL